MAGNIRVDAMREVPVVRDGRPAIEMEVVFHVGTHGPFVERMDKAMYNAAVMRAKLEERARDVELVAGPGGGG